MVTRCPPCGVERIGSRSPGALGLFWGTESTAPGRSSPRPRTASPYPTMWSLPSVIFRSFVLFLFFFFGVHFCVSHYSVPCFYFFPFVRSGGRLLFPFFIYFFFFCVFAVAMRRSRPPNVTRGGGRGEEGTHTQRRHEECAGRVPVIARGASPIFARFSCSQSGETTWRQKRKEQKRSIELNSVQSRLSIILVLLATYMMRLNGGGIRFGGGGCERERGNADTFYVLKTCL